jgi:hypothetical protein
MLIEYNKFHQCIEDPVIEAKCNGKFQLYFCQELAVSEIRPYYTLEKMIETINHNLDYNGLESFEHTDHRRPTVDIAQFVKINQLYHSLKNSTNIKPWLVLETNNQLYTACGDTRRRALQLLPHITTVAAFVNLKTNSLIDSSEWTPVDTFYQMATCICCNIGTALWFHVSPDSGLEWYEVAIDHTTNTVGSVFRPRCVEAIKNYVKQQSNNFRFSIDWFRQEINWNQYVLE